MHAEVKQFLPFLMFTWDLYTWSLKNRTFLRSDLCREEKDNLFIIHWSATIMWMKSKAKKSNISQLLASWFTFVTNVALNK